MRRYLPLLLFIGLSWGQIEVNLKNGFLYEGTHIDIPKSKEPLENTEFTLLNAFGEKIKIKGIAIETITKNDITIWDPEKNELNRMNCEKNNKIKVMVMPFRDDIYGITEHIEKKIEDDCFKISSNLLGLEYLHKQKLNKELIDDYLLLQIGEENLCDFIIYGYTSEYQEPYAFSSISNIELYQDDVTTLSSSSSDNTLSALNKILNNYNKTQRKKIQKQSKAIEKILRDKEMQESGTYITLTYFSIDINTKEKTYLLQNEVVLKKGSGISLHD